MKKGAVLMWPSLTGGSGIGRIREAWRFLRGLPPYDGGSLDRRNSGWSPIDGTGEAVNQLSRDLVRARARDLERNSDTVCAIIEALERNVVGSGIKLQAKVMDGDEENDALNNQIEALWQEWCNFKNCDIGGQLCFSEMQKLAVRRRIVDGGLFFLFCTDRTAKIPLRLQIKEVNELDTGNLECNGNKVVAGIEVDEFGKPTAYHFKKFDIWGWTGESVRVDAENVIFISNKMRTSEVREISPLARILSRLRDLNQYIEAVAVKERLMACLGVLIAKKTKGFAIGRPDDTVQRKPDRPRSRRLYPGMMEEIDPGDDVTVINPSGQASDAEQFISLMIRSIGASMGLSYEAVSRDMRKGSYSSARQGMIDDFKTYRMWQHYLIEHLCKPVYEKFLDHAVLSGQLPIPDYFENRKKYIQCAFIPGGMSWIDPQKEVNANQQAILSNQTTLEEICASRGNDYKEVLRQRAKEKRFMEELGLTEHFENDKTGGGNNESQQDADEPGEGDKE